MRHLKLVQDTESSTAQLRLAFASSDHSHVDQHFGAAVAYVVYQLDQYQARLVEVIDLLAETGPTHGQLPKRIELLAGCCGVYCNAVGASAIQQLLAQGVQPLKVEPGTDIDSLLKTLQAEWDTNPPLWLQRILKQQSQQDSTRFDAMALRDWSEEEY